ncbi:MAG: hypothetical protein ACI4QW_06495 [Clostridia bacterium]
MKKLLSMQMALIVFLLAALLCYAGDVPEGLLANDSAQVYFGEIQAISGESITVIQKKNIKGEFEQDKAYTYPNQGLPNFVTVGQIYLCGYYDEHNPLYVWEVSSLDTKTLKIRSTDDMSKRLEQYLHEGQFDEAEAKRRANPDNVTANADSTAVVGGADAPANIFPASRGSLWVMGAAAAVVLALVLLYACRQRHE